MEIGAAFEPQDALDIGGGSTDAFRGCAALADLAGSAGPGTSACKGAVYNVRINVTSMSDRSLGEGLLNEAKQVLARTAKATRAVESIIERQLT